MPYPKSAEQATFEWMPPHENLWIKPHIHLIKIKAHFGAAHFDDKFPTFGIASCFMVPAPFLAWLGFAKFLVEIILVILIGS